MKCENCAAWNAKVIQCEDTRMLLCHKCLKIYKDLNKEYMEIVQGIQTHSYGHIVKENVE
jgi:hypothetical protein